MTHQVEVHHDNGRIDVFPETAFASAFGASAQDDLSFRFDADIEAEGLVVELRHHEPMEPDKDDLGFVPEARGVPCQAIADAYAVLVAPDEAAGVVLVKYNSTIVYKRIAGELVNFSKLNVLAGLYYDEERTMGTLLLIADLHTILQERRRRALATSLDPGGGPQDEEEAIAAELGVSMATLALALDYKAYCEEAGEEAEVYEEAEAYGEGD